MARHRIKRVSPSKRKAVWERDQNRCRYCGWLCIPMNQGSHPDLRTIDHIIPVHRGGTYELDNLVVACCSCNTIKAGRTPEEAGMTLLPVPIQLAPVVLQHYTSDDETPYPERFA